MSYNVYDINGKWLGVVDASAKSIAFKVAKKRWKEAAFVVRAR